MPDIERFCGLPWKLRGDDFDGVDCWGLVCLYFRETRGVIIPITGAGNAFSMVNIPQPDDIAFFIAPSIWHAGVILPGDRVLHVDEASPSRVSRLNSMRLSPNRQYFRWAQ